MAMPILTLPAFGAGITLVALGPEARLWWTARRAAAGATPFGVLIALFGLLVGAPSPWLAAPVAPAAAAGVAALFRRRDRRLLARLVAAHDRGAALEPVLDDLITSPRPVVFEAAALLTEWGRFDLLERLGTYAMVPGTDSLRRYHLAAARLGRGDPDSALAIARSANHTANGPIVAEEWSHLVARIRIARGEAADVIAGFPRTGPLRSPLALARRLLVLADAHAAIGDLATARALVTEVAAAHGGHDLLLVLRASRRPSAAIAASMLADAGPYR